MVGDRWSEILFQPEHYDIIRKQCNFYRSEQTETKRARAVTIAHVN